MKNNDVIDRIYKLSEDLNDLLKARALLEQVYIEIGPYKDGAVSDETWRKVRDYFKFDDSE